MTTEPKPQEQFSLTDLFDVQEFQYLATSFTKLTGIATAILDLEGTIIIESGWQSICKEYHRKDPMTAARCRESDTILASQINQGQKYNVYRCKNGLVDVAVPIIIDDLHLGNLFMGQFFFAPPNIDEFTRQAGEFGFNKEEYLRLLKEVPVMSYERVERAMAFLTDLTAIICKTGMDKKQLLNFNMGLEIQVADRTNQIQRERVFSESLINSLPGMMYVFDQSGRFKRWNKNFEVVTGYSGDEIKGLNPIDLFDTTQDKRQIEHAIEKVFRTGRATVEGNFTTKGGKQIPHLFTGYKFVQDDIPYLVGVGLDISDRIETEKEKEDLILQLQETLSQVKKLSGFLPICASCKKIRDDAGYWNQIESYIRDNSEAEFSHSICPECVDRLYPDFNPKKES